MNIVAITACAVGIAHTYMAADGLKEAAKKRNWKIKVETQGSVGAENQLTDKEIENADLVIIAADVNVDLMRFVGKKVYKTASIEAIDNADEVLDLALEKAEVFGAKGTKVGNVELGKTDNEFVKHIMSGISYMVPMCIAAGLLLAIANIFAFQKNELGQIVCWGFDTETSMGYFMQKLFYTGQVGFKLMIPLFAGFVAKSIADKPAIAPAMIGAYLANDPEFLGTETGGGFLAAILVAFLVGYFVKYLKGLSWPKILQPLLGIMILPLIATFAIVVVELYLLGGPIASMMDWLYTTLTELNNTYSQAPFIIGAVIGAMMGFDFGGPVNKTALIFGTAVFTDTVAKYGIQNANFVPGTAAQAAISVAPLGIWLASIMFKDKFTYEEKVAANSAFGMGIVGVTEGAIPFAASNPVQIITASVAGSALAGGLVGITGCKFYGGIGSPLGTFIGYIEQPIPFITWIGCTFAGIFLTAIIIGLWRKPVDQTNDQLPVETANTDDTVFSNENVFIDTTSTTQDEAFKFIAQKAFELGYASDKEAFYKGLLKRESEVTTGLKDGIAIPHSNDSSALKPGLIVVKFTHDIEWSSLDGSQVNTAFALVVPENGADNHLKMLSAIATELMDDTYRNQIADANDTDELYQLAARINL